MEGHVLARDNRATRPLRARERRARGAGAARHPSSQGRDRGAGTRPRARGVERERNRPVVEEPRAFRPLPSYGSPPCAGGSLSGSSSRWTRSRSLRVTRSSGIRRRATTSHRRWTPEVRRRHGRRRGSGRRGSGRRGALDAALDADADARRCRSDRPAARDRLGLPSRPRRRKRGSYMRRHGRRRSDGVVLGRQRSRPARPRHDRRRHARGGRRDRHADHRRRDRPAVRGHRGARARAVALLCASAGRALLLGAAPLGRAGGAAVGYRAGPHPTSRDRKPRRHGRRGGRAPHVRAEGERQARVLRPLCLQRARTIGRRRSPRATRRSSMPYHALASHTCSGTLVESAPVPGAVGSEDERGRCRRGALVRARGRSRVLLGDEPRRSSSAVQARRAASSTRRKSSPTRLSSRRSTRSRRSPPAASTPALSGRERSFAGGRTTPASSASRRRRLRSAPLRRRSRGSRTSRRSASRSSVTCAVRTDKTVWCWGADIASLPDGGAIVSTPAPTQIKGPAGVGVLSDVVEVAPGLRHVCARKADSTVWCWGKNDRGQLGDGTTVDSPFPVKVTGLP